MLTSEILLGSEQTRSWTLLPHPYSWGCAGTRPKYPQTHSSSFLCSILYPGDDKDPGPCSLSLPSVRLCSASGRWCQGVAGGGRGSRGTSLPPPCLSGAVSAAAVTPPRLQVPNPFWFKFPPNASTAVTVSTWRPRPLGSGITSPSFVSPA